MSFYPVPVFEDLSDALAYVDRLRAHHRTTGNWSLAQICRHLADSVNGSIDGFGVRRHRIMRRFFGRMALRNVFREGVLGDGFTVTESLTPPPDADLEESIEDLRRAIERYRAHIGPVRFHPFFGTLTRPEWDRLHRIHCAHHLRHAVPDAP